MGLGCSNDLYLFSLVWRSPDIARVRSKMLYASSKDRFKRELDGIQVELQATDPTEMGLDVIRGRANWVCFSLQSGCFNDVYSSVGGDFTRYHIDLWFQVILHTNFPVLNPMLLGCRMICYFVESMWWIVNVCLLVAWHLQAYDM